MNHYTSIIYTNEIKVSKPASDVFQFITELKRWWIEAYIGEELKLDSVFELKLGEGHYSKNKVLDFIPNKKLVWLTTESMRRSDNFDWTGTKMIFELNPINNGTQITFTYDGVVFENEQDRLKEICDYCIKDLLYNGLESFSTTIEVPNTSAEVFKCLTEVTKWWSKDFEGSSINLNDEFVIHHPNQHYSRQKLIEVIPGKKIVWLVTESQLHWLQNNQQEWSNTKMLFEIRAQDHKTTIHFTHYGLVPEIECYDMCKQGWTMIIQNWLHHFITQGTETAEMTKAAEIRNQILTDKQNNL